MRDFKLLVLMSSSPDAPMARTTPPEKQPLDVAHILQKHIADYQRKYPLWSEHRKIVSNLINCRTVKLGGCLERCDICGVLRITYHSCRNRHCPKCQHMPQERWFAKREKEILPICYYHVIFTRQGGVLGHPTHLGPKA